MSADVSAVGGRGERRGEPAWSLVLVSDLHMSSGSTASTGMASTHERFHHDEELAHFLTHLADRVSANGDVHLVLLGDTFDFLHAALEGPDGGRLGSQTSEAVSLERFARIAAGHEEVLRGLAEFVSRGGHVSLVAGNHDPELIRPSAQDAVLAALGARAYGVQVAPRVAFHPWIFFVPGVVYAEHGQQYHDLNALANVLRPYANGNVDRLALPLGSHLARYLEARAARSSLPATLRARFAGLVLRELVARWDPRRARRRTAYRDGPVREYAAASGLPARVLLDVERLAAVGPGRLERRATRLASEQLRRAARPATGNDRDASDASRSLRRAAAAIDAILAREGLAVPFYVFGHTHAPEDRPLRASGTLPRYLNPGSWSALVPRHLRRLDDAARLTYVEIVGSQQGHPTARLLVWDDTAGRPEAASARA